VTRSSFVFETVLGPCAIGWTERGVSRMLLPGDDLTLPGYRRVERPPAAIGALVERIRAHLAGTPHDFSDVALDLEGVGDFSRAVYQASRAVGSGQVSTYGEIAGRLGKPGAARAVGQALGRNPLPLLVPCHRVLAAGGKSGGFSAPGGLETKARMLAAEGYLLNPLRNLWEEGAKEEAVGWLRKRDGRMRRLIERVGPCLLERESTTVFEALCEAIIYQQLAGKAAASITRRFMGLFSGPPTAAAVAALDDETARAAGLSTAKIAALRTLSAAALEGRVALERIPGMADDEVARHLTALKGIGPWTVQMLLIFHLGRPDVFPPGDLGIRKAVQNMTGAAELPAPADLLPLAEKWKPWRTVATWYLWRSLGTTTMGDPPTSRTGEGAGSSRGR
jgi:methylated-DNA-[protein]-cysteine S-methyltransferase